jgi:hypothetical protein
MGHTDTGFWTLFSGAEKARGRSLPPVPLSPHTATVRTAAALVERKQHLGQVPHTQGHWGGQALDSKAGPEGEQW